MKKKELKKLYKDLSKRYSDQNFELSTLKIKYGVGDLQDVLNTTKVYAYGNSTIPLVFQTHGNGNDFDLDKQKDTNPMFDEYEKLSNRLLNQKTTLEDINKAFKERTIVDIQKERDKTKEEREIELIEEFKGYAEVDDTIYFHVFNPIRAKQTNADVEMRLALNIKPFHIKDQLFIFLNSLIKEERIKMKTNEEDNKQ